MIPIILHHIIQIICFNPIKWRLCGGPDVMIVSILFSTMYFSKNFTEGFTHKNLASGINKLPRMVSKNRSKNDCFFLFVIMPALNFFDLFLEK